MARSTMAALIARERLLINDPAGGSQVFSDDDIQNVLDESRMDIKNQPLIAKPTYSGSTIQYLDYWSEYGGWEDGYVLKQYLTVTVTPSVLEPIAGHFGFSSNVFPPVFISGSVHDLYRGAADLLERWAAKYMLQFAFSSDGQSFHPEQIQTSIDMLVKKYRQKQRPTTLSMVRSDLRPVSASSRNPLGPREIDYMGSG